MTTVTPKDIANFVENLQGMVDAHHLKMGHTRFNTVIEADTGGRKYIRITSATAHKDETGKVVAVNGKSVFCFVEMSTGRVFKAASGKTPAKHARGSIFGTSPEEWGVTPYGGAYL